MFNSRTIAGCRGFTLVELLVAALTRGRHARLQAALY
jgi:hypothetical protein